MKAAVEAQTEGAERDLFLFAISSILVPVSNVKYGPGFGIGKPKEDADVLQAFRDKVNMMLTDLRSVTDVQRRTLATTLLGDSRSLTDYVAENSISLMITSPPYPGDHEYTKHSKLELIIRIQPDEGILQRIAMKEPGAGFYMGTHVQWCEYL